MNSNPSPFLKVLGHPLLAALLRIGLGLLFLWVAKDKIADPQDFARAVAAYQIVPAQTVNLVAIAVPFIELVASVCLLLGLFNRASATVIAGLLFSFIVILISAIARGLDIDCGCFGPSVTHRIGWDLVLSDFLLMLAACQVVLWDRGHLSPVALLRGLGRSSGDGR